MLIKVNGIKFQQLLSVTEKWEASHIICKVADLPKSVKWKKTYVTFRANLQRLVTKNEQHSILF